MQQAFIYCRVSTEEQAREGYSLDAQEKLCVKFAQEHGYTVAGVYRDEGRSGTSLHRPALQDMLARCQQDGNVSAVVVQETDRLARNTLDHLTIRAVLNKAGAELISVAQPMLDDSPEGKMIDTILASVNQFQSDINSRKTGKALQEKFDGGWWPGWAPLGYLNKKAEDKGIIVQDAQRWHLVQEGFRLYLTGNHSAAELADILWEKGLRSKTGKKVCNSIMNHILRNPFYAGIMRWNGQEKLAKHKPIITLQDHERVLQIMALHNLHASRSRKHRFLLSGFAFCNICGARYTAEKHPAKGLAYYHCAFSGRRGKERGHTNGGQNVEVGVLERQVEDQFQRIQFSQEFIDLVLIKLKEVHAQQRTQTQAQKRPLHNQRLALERRREMAEEKLLSGVISDRDYVRIRRKLDRQVAQIDGQLAALERTDDTTMNVLTDVLHLARNIHRAYKETLPELKREYLALFWERFLVQDRKIVRAEPTPLVQALLKEQKVIIRGNWLRW